MKRKSKEKKENEIDIKLETIINQGYLIALTAVNENLKEIIKQREEKQK